MKKLLIALGISAAVVSGAASAAELTFDRATPLETQVTFGGVVITDTCDYASPVGRGFSKNLGEHQQNQLNNDRQTAAADFSFEFKNCPVTGTKGKTSLSMWVDDSKPLLIENPTNGLLKNQATGANAATNVAVQLLKEDESVLQLGKTLETVDKPLPSSGSGDVKFTFKARLYSPEGKTTSGNVSALAPFMVEYK